MNVLLSMFLNVKLSSFYLGGLLANKYALGVSAWSVALFIYTRAGHGLVFQALVYLLSLYHDLHM